MFKINYFMVLMTVFCVVAFAAPIQELPPKAGYVPVYIREGNTPLSQVNPKLVEAFHEDEDTYQLQIENEKIKRNAAAVVEAKVDEIEEQKPKDKDDEIPEAKANDDLKIEPHKENSNAEEAEISDIAEFTSEDIKILANEKTDN